MDWRNRAVCVDEDPELFFPAGTSGPALLQISEAKAVCRRCPVSGECLSWALTRGEAFGIWGGLSEDERRAVKRRNARIRAVGVETCRGRVAHVRTDANTRIDANGQKICMECDPGRARALERRAAAGQ